MTYREVEQTLNRARDCGFEIAAKMATKEEMLAIATSITSQLRGDAGASLSKDPHRKMESYVIDTEEISGQIYKLWKQKVKAIRLIEMVEDGRQKTVLSEYYINRHTWDEVCEILCLEPDGKHVFKLRRWAIEEIAKKTS